MVNAGCWSICSTTTETVELNTVLCRRFSDMTLTRIQLRRLFVRNAGSNSLIAPPSALPKNGYRHQLDSWNIAGTDNGSNEDNRSSLSLKPVDIAAAMV